jgi:hypothetical protein
MLEVEQLGVLVQLPQGRPGTLSQAEEAKLRQLWHLMLWFSGIASTAEQTPNGTPSQPPALWRTASGSGATAEEKDKSKLRSPSNKIRNESNRASPTTAPAVLPTPTSGGPSA